eukprot:253035-Pyramimonas_sp.AAC.1
MAARPIFLIAGESCESKLLSCYVEWQGFLRIPIEFLRNPMDVLRSPWTSGENVNIPPGPRHLIIPRGLLSEGFGYDDADRDDGDAADDDDDDVVVDAAAADNDDADANAAADDADDDM